MFFKKSLKIPKEQSESVNRRRTDNTMAKRTNVEVNIVVFISLYVFNFIPFCLLHISGKYITICCYGRSLFQLFRRVLFD